MTSRSLATFLITLLALASWGCGSSSDFNQVSGQQSNVGINVPNPNPNPGGPPVATDDTGFAINATGTLTVPAPGVLANDTLNGGAITNFPTTTTRGGTVQLTPDGGFTYTAPATSGADTFQYSLTSANGTSTATVNIQVVGNAVFVNNQAAAGGNGSFAAPFNTIAAAVAAATGGNNTIFVFRGNGNAYNEAITLQDGQRLIGEGAGLAVLGRGEGEALEQAVAPNFPVLTGPITMGNGNTVQGVRVQGAPGDAITSSGNGGTVTGCQFDSNGMDAVQLDTASGTWTFSDNSITNQPRGFNATGALQTGAATYIITGNAHDNTTVVMQVSSGGTSNVNALVANNTATNTSGAESFNFIASGNSTLCVDFVGNTTNAGYRFTPTGSGTLNLEQATTIAALNTGTPTLDAGVNEVADGFCGF